MVRIRDFKVSDASKLAQIYHDAVRLVGSRDYSQEQIEAWSPRPVSAEQFIQRVSDGRCVFVAVDQDDTPLGFIELEDDGHIDCFYCGPQVAGTGVGAELYGHLERAASGAKLSRLYVEASEAARRFFLRNGFSQVKRRDFVLRGVPIHNFLMEKRLGEADSQSLLGIG